MRCQHFSFATVTCMSFERLDVTLDGPVFPSHPHIALTLAYTVWFEMG